MNDQELRDLVAKVFGGPSGYRSFNAEEALKVHPHLMKDFEGIARAVPKLLDRIANLESQVEGSNSLLGELDSVKP